MCRELDSVTHAKETLMSHEVPSRPWEKIATDIFTLDGKDYLVTIDYYSVFWEVDRLPNTKGSTTILKLKSHFARYGIPDQVISDNGPQFTSDEFANFARTWDFEHLTSSPGNSKAKVWGEDSQAHPEEINQGWNRSIPCCTRLQKHTHTRNDNQSSTTLDEPKNQDTPSYNSEPTTA